VSQGAGEFRGVAAGTIAVGGKPAAYGRQLKAALVGAGELAGPEEDGEEVGLKERQGLNEEAGFHGRGVPVLNKVIRLVGGVGEVGADEAADVLGEVQVFFADAL